MKSFKIFIFNLGVMTMCLFAVSCTREFPQVAGLDTNVGTGATIQVFNATVKALRNFVYVDGVPVSGVGLGYGGVFPATAYGFKVTAGSRAITIKDTATVTAQTPITFTQAFNAGKSYTIFTYDTITSAKQSVIVNNIIIPTDTSSRLRFANFIYNATSVANVDVYSFRKGGVTGLAAAPVFANIATTTVTDFIAYPSGQTDTLYVYATGTTTPLIVKQLVISLTPTRSYTSVYSGSFIGTKAVSTIQTY